MDFDFPAYYIISDGRVWDIENACWVEECPDQSRAVALQSGGKPAGADYLLRTLKFYDLPAGDLEYEVLTLDELKQKRLDELTAAAAKFQESSCADMYFYSSLGFRVNGDRKASQDIEGLVFTFDDVASAGEGEDADPVVSFMDYDNNVQQLTLANLNVLQKEHALNGQYLYQQKWLLRSAINSSESAEELKTIIIAFSMSDFFEEDY